jgi:hypothetical protein
MKVLAIEHEVAGVAASDFGPHLRAGGAGLELQQAGIIREIYFRVDRAEAVVMLECTDGAQANEVLHSLPLVEADLITFEVIPLKPYPGLSRLVAKESVT